MAKHRKYFGQLQRNNGRFSSLTVSLEGDWGACEVALNNLLKVPEYVRDGLVDVVHDTIVPTMDFLKNNGDGIFEENAPSTLARKGNLPPWYDGNNTTGEPTAFVVDGGNTIRVALGGEDSTVTRGKSTVKVKDIIQMVDGGTEYAPSRPLFMYTWELSESDVKNAVKSLFANCEYMG